MGFCTMTEQPKEYIITECLIQKWLELDYSVRDIATEIRSGTYTASTPPEGAAPEPDYSRHNPRIELRKVCEQEAHDAAIREETLDKVIAILKSESGDCPDDTKCSDEDYGTKDCSICWIESLRQPKQKKEGAA